jgi:hypothetical protein
MQLYVPFGPSVGAHPIESEPRARDPGWPSFGFARFFRN